MAAAMATEFDARGLEERLGYEFRDRQLLDAALTHASALPAGVVRTSEQLEFLGDAVVDLVIADLLLKTLPYYNEGELSKLRAQLVRTSTLATKARELGLGAAMRLGRGEDRSGGRSKASILAATYEAVVGAIYRDAGFHRAKAIVGRHFQREISAIDTLVDQDWKTLLQERTQAQFRVVPQYRLVAQQGPAHARQFTSEVWVNDECVASGEGASKREAEQHAARAALTRLREEEQCRVSSEEEGRVSGVEGKGRTVGEEE
jgi:ribonuclease III